MALSTSGIYSAGSLPRYLFKRDLSKVNRCSSMTIDFFRQGLTLENDVCRKICFLDLACDRRNFDCRAVSQSDLVLHDQCRSLPTLFGAYRVVPEIDEVNITSPYLMICLLMLHKLLMCSHTRTSTFIPQHWRIASRNLQAEFIQFLVINRNVIF